MQLDLSLSGLTYLHKWGIIQRRDLKHGKCSEERVRILHALGIFPNNIDRQKQWDEKWNLMFQRLKRHLESGSREVRPGCWIPEYYRTLPKDMRLWVQGQRQAYQEGKLPKNRADKLNRIGFIWAPQSGRWMASFNRVKHCVSKSGWDSLKEYELDWCVDQRAARRKGTLSQDRIELLDSIKFPWDRSASTLKIENDKCWMERLEEFKQHRYDYWKHPRINNWIGNQRSSRRRGELSQHRWNLLVETGINTARQVLCEATWNSNYEELKRFWEQHAIKPSTCWHFSIGDKTPPRRKLQQWAACQRRMRRLGKLLAWQITKLNNIGFPWGRQPTRPARLCG